MLSRSSDRQTCMQVRSKRELDFSRNRSTRHPESRFVQEYIYVPDFPRNSEESAHFLDILGDESAILFLSEYRARGVFPRSSVLDGREEFNALTIDNERGSFIRSDIVAEVL